MSNFEITGYVFAAVAIVLLIISIAMLVWFGLPADPKYHPFLRKKAERKTEEYFRGADSFTAYWDDCRKQDYPHRQYRNHLKKSKWSQIRKARKKEEHK